MYKPERWKGQAVLLAQSFAISARQWIHLPKAPDYGAMRVGAKINREERAMDLLGWIIIGLLAGAIAKLIMPGRDPGGCIVTILLGIAGALLAGFVGRLAGFYAPGERAGFIAAILGSVAVLALYRWFAARR
ncbi:hypothetical protein MBESOW_P3251 [Sphingobium xenophagum]|uniref:Transglycosylase associated protein n=3 Tax=Sphingomonadaceae TaxID=41297 RepID=A0A401J5Y1_SPHXE|nr:hypothetical protein MBESOW_P3251 [Sphingobium xenophagum]